MNETRRSIRTSITALILCFIMLVGTTFAWFTDEVTSANNIIKTGNLDIGMLWSSDNTNWNDTEGALAKPVFNNDKWEPGYTEVRYIKVQNLGSLAFQYKMTINPTDGIGMLAEVIDVSYDIVTGNDNFVAPTAADKQGSLTKVATLKELILANGTVAGGVLLPESESAEGYYSGEIVVCISFHMQESAGNEYQNANIGGDFGINLYATQFDYENDSFDSSYDDEAEWPDMGINESASAEINSDNLVLGALTSAVTLNNGNVSATIPEDVKVEDGATSLNLTVKSADADSNISYGEDGNAKGFDVHIAGVAADNTKPMIVNLGAVLPTGLSDTELKLYHTENGVPTEMYRVNSAADFAIHNQYTYNAETGEVSIYVATFSIFSAVKTSADVWDGTSDTSWYEGHESDSEYTLNSAAAFAGFRDLVDGGNTFAGKTVKLGVDIDLAGKSFDPIGYGYNTVFSGTFDGGNHTIYGLYQNGWELSYSYGTQGGGLFASVKDATIKNLVISGANIKMECVDMGIVVGYAQGTCHFENIVVTDSKIANYNRYTGGVVGEVSGGSYGTDVTKGYSHTFKNIVVDSSVVVSSLWGSFDTSIGGVIGGKWGDATVKMENVIVAAELDVYSDVTAAYQWYAYRRCGMLIGHTEQNSPKSALNADAPFLTCENVRVFYGDWVNYDYYQFEKQDSDTGKRYPWVRAEASPVDNNGAFSNPRYGVPTHGGVAVTDENKDQYNTGYAPITFNQLYGGGQGVYGKADHEGVSIDISSNTTTIYFQNSKGWENLKLQYIYKVGENTYTTVVEGISLGEAVDTVPLHHIYKVVVPADAYAFEIIGANAGETTGEIALNGLVKNHLYSVDSNNDVQHTEYNGKYKTVYFQNNWKWDKVYIYYWHVNEDGAWDTLAFPGESMTKVTNDGTYDIYKFVVPAYAYGFVFSNGTKVSDTNHKQSVDITVNEVTDGHIYSMYWHDEINDVISYEYKSGYKAILFENYWKWNNVTCYYWTSSSNNGWPGKAMTKIGTIENRDLYIFYVSTSTKGVIFVGNNNSDGGQQQTVDITSFANGAIYKHGDWSNGKVTVIKVN